MERKTTSGTDCARGLLRREGPVRYVGRRGPARRLRRIARTLAGIDTHLPDPDVRRLPRALEWLTDNRWLLRSALQSAGQALSGLPRCPGKTPYVLTLCEEMVRRDL